MRLINVLSLQVRRIFRIIRGILTIQYLYYSCHYEKIKSQGIIGYVNDTQVTRFQS